MKDRLTSRRLTTGHSLGWCAVSEYGERTMTGQIGYLTGPTKLVLRALLDESGPFWNYGLTQQLRINQTTVNNVLRRLGEAGWATSTLESPDAKTARGGGPPRLYWELTDEGRQAATERLAEAEQRQARGRELPDEMSSHSIGASQTEPLRTALEHMLVMLDDLESSSMTSAEARPRRELARRHFVRAARESDRVAHQLTAQLGRFRADLAPVLKPVAALDF